ncbi:MAG: Ig-like domain-containing protein [Rikenellaceae bacterium]
MNKKEDMNIQNKYIVRGLNLAVVIFFVSAFFIRCASIMTPDGGPYDTIAPVIVAMTPENYTTNFTGKKIYVEFDEFVKITDQSKEFFTSPQMKTKPKLSTKGRGVMVTLGDSLLPNTTYALNFGATIKDNNEGNPLYSMRYVFSTGDEIDSMMMSGYAEDSFESDSVSGAMIYFFIADSVEYNEDYDSTMFNYTPAVIARAELNGVFLAQNLKPIDYRVYAFEDRNNNFTYEPETDQVGFIEGLYNPSSMPDFSLWFDSLRGYVVADPQLHFKLFEDKAFKRQNLQESQRPKQHQALLYFNTENPQIERISLDSIAQDDLIVEYMSKGRDTVAVWFNVDSDMIPDTLRGSITYFKHDSIRELVETKDTLRLTWRYIESKEEQKERERLEREREKAEELGEEWEEPAVVNPFKVAITSAGAINPDLPLVINFDYPLIEIDSSAITMAYISPDSVRSAQSFTLQRDSVNLRRWYVNTKFDKQEGQYELVIPDSTFRNVAREVNDSVVLSYTIYKPEEYATINVNFTKPEGDEADYIIELLSNNNKLLDYKVASTSGGYKFKYIPASDVRLRVIKDDNRDGERSSGNLVQRLTPERVSYFEKDGESTFTMKVNWEYDFELNATDLFIEENMESLIKRLEQEEFARIQKAAADKANNQNQNNNRNR